MDEAKRFLRYVTPGLVFFTEIFLLLWVIEPDVFPLLLKDFTEVSGGTGLVIGTLLASGGVGYMFSVVHHQFHWIDWFGKRAVDHRPFIHSLRERGIVRLMNRDSRDALTEEIKDRFQAWTITTGLWHERLSKGDSIVKAADPRSSSLADLVHSLGTARVAAVTALVVALLILWWTCDWAPEPEAIARFLLGIVPASLFMILCEIGYRRTGRGAQRFVEQVLDDALTRERTDENKARPIETYVAA